jgi:hypothetical protein
VQEARPRRRLRRILAFTALGLFALLSVALAGATALLQGERLGRIVGGALTGLAGKLQLGALTWSARLYRDLLTDTPTPLVVEGLLITDPDGTVVLRAPRLEVKVQPRSAIAGKIYLHDLKLGPGSFWRFAKMKNGKDIGFLAAFDSKNKPAEPPPPPKPVSKEDEFVLQIVNAELDGFTAQFDFPGAWGLELRDIRSPASFILQGDFVGWDAPNLDARGGGYLKIIDDVLPFDRVQVGRVATTREWPNDIFLEVKAARTGRSTLTAKGFFTGIYGYGYKKGEEPPSGIALHAEFSDAGDALSAVAARRAIPGLRVGGEQVRVALDLKDPFERLKIDGSLQGLDAAFGTYEARALEVAFGLDLGVPMGVAVKRLAFSSPGGGQLALSASLKGPKADAKLSFARFSTDSYVPAGLRKTAAGTLDGGFHLRADLDDKGVSVEKLDLRFARRFAAGLPRKVNVRGQATASPAHAATKGITIELPGASVTARGRFDLARQGIGLALRATASDLPRLLRVLGLPPLARSASLAVDVGGTTSAPEARGSLTVRQVGVGGLPKIGTLDARFSLTDGTARLDSLAGDVLGGRLEASGSVRLFERTLAHMVRSPVVSARLDGRQLDLATLVAEGLVRGRIDVHAQVEGPTDKLHATLTLPPGAQLEVMGTRWILQGIDLETDLRSATLRLARLEAAGGGRIDVTGRISLEKEMAMHWEIAIKDLPLAGLPGVKDAGVPLEGRLGLQLTVEGTPARPVPSGELALLAVAARGVKLGDGHLRFTPTAAGGVAVEGRLFDRFRVTAGAAYAADGPRVDATVAFKDLVLEELLPEMEALGNARGRLTGTVKLHLEPGSPLALEARLTDVDFAAARQVTDAAGKTVTRHIGVRNGSDVRVVLAGDHIIVDRTRLVMDGGEFKLWGELQNDRIAGEVEGRLNLDLLQPFIADRVEHLAGAVALSLHVAGTRSKPLGDGLVTIGSPIKVKLRDIPSEIAVPSGSIKLSPRALSLSDLAVEVEGARLALQGRAEFDEAQNVSGIELGAKGEVDGRLLESLAANAISDASGRARLEARVSGTLAAPKIQARVDLGNLKFRLRDLGREIAVEGGTIEATSTEVLLRNIRARVDGQGLLTIGTKASAPGRIAFKRMTPAPEIEEVSLPLHGERLSFRVSNTIDLDDFGFDLEVAGDPTGGFGIDGEVLVASGRYVRDFTVRNLVISPSTDESAVRAFYDGKPLLENLELDLRVRTIGDSFMVQNNLAPEIHVIFDLLVHGTLAQPLIAGDVRPTDGRFHIFGVRGDFALVPNVNHVTFVDTKSIADGETPELNLEAEATVTDSSAREHLVQMRISGPIGQAQIDLATQDGLDRNQALLLLLSGRTSEQETVFGTQNPTLGANVRTGTDVIGQISRDSVADFLEPYIDDTLQLLTGRKINLRPTVGPDGFELRVDARVSRQLDLRLSLLRGLEERRQYRAELGVWIMDYLSVRGFGEQITFTPQPGITEDFRSLKLELTLDFPIRLFLR